MTKRKLRNNLASQPIQLCDGMIGDIGGMSVDEISEYIDVMSDECDEANAYHQNAYNNELRDESNHITYLPY